MNHRARAAGLFLFLLNTAYLAAYASPTAWYFANLGIHIALGIALAVAYGLELRTAWPRAPLWVRLSSLVLAAGVAFGLAIVVIGAYGPYRWLLPVHIALSLAGGVPLLAAAAAVQVRQSDPQRRLAAGIGILVIAAAGSASAIAVAGRPAARDAAYRIVNPLVPPMVMDEEGAGPSSPFFPSSADTNVHGIIPATFFMTSESCGRCHKDIYEQWKSSAHHFSSFNNQWYRKSIEYMQDVVGTQPSKWCAGCHDHAVFFNGRFDRPIKEQIDTPEAQAGLGCTSCHSITHVRSTMGQGDFEIEYPPLHDLAASENPVLRFVHDQLTYIDPAAAPRDLPQAVPPRADAGVLLVAATRSTSTCRSTATAGSAASTTTTTGRRRACRARARARSTTRRSRRSAPTATCRWSPRTIRRRRTARSARTASPPPTPRCRSSTATPMQLKAVQDFLQDGQISVDVFGLVRDRAPASRRAADASQAPAEPRLASTFAVGEESMNFGAAAELPRAGRGGHRAARQGGRGRSGAANRSASKSWSARARSATSSPAEPSMRSTSGSSSKRWTSSGRTIFHSGAVADDGKGPGRIRARTSIAACCSTSTATRSTSATPGRRGRSPTCG